MGPETCPTVKPANGVTSAMSMPQPKPLERLLVQMVLVSLLAWIVVLSVQRWQMDSQPYTIELAFPEAQLLEAAQQDPQAPAALLAAGVTTLVRKAYTLEDMIRYGLAKAWHPEPDQLEIHLADERLTSNATVYLTGQLGMDSLQVRLRKSEYILDVHLPAPVKQLDPSCFILEVPSGPMPTGFYRALWLPAGDWGKTQDLNQFTQALYSLQPDGVILDWRGGVGAQYFFRSYIQTPWLRRPQIILPEYSLPWVARSILRQARTNYLARADILTPAIVQQYPAQRLRQRWVRAVRERRVHWLYVEPPRHWSFQHSLELIRSLHQGLVQAGFTLGPASPLRPVRMGHLAANCIYVGVGALFFLFLWQAGLWAMGVTGQDESVDRVLTIRLQPAHFRWAALFLIFALWILHWQGSMAWGTKAAALLIALFVPYLNLSFLPKPLAAEKRWSQVWLASLKTFSGITLASLAAGLTISVLLYQQPFLLRLDGFFGVKCAYIVPLLLVGFYLFPSVFDPGWWQCRWQKGRRLLIVIGLAMIISLLVLLLFRTGNTLWWPTSDWEQNLRDSLERWLGVRPRFKEFLLGHPLLLLGLAGRQLTAQQDKIWPEICLLIGWLGQVSLINTFCHIHTPLAISLARIGHGLWLGALLGSGCLWLAWWHQVSLNQGPGK